MPYEYTMVVTEEAMRTALTRLDIAVNALEEISECKTYVESQSTGMRQYFPEEGAHLARKALLDIECMPTQTTPNKGDAK